MKKDSVLKTNKLITMKNNLVFKEIYKKKEWENHLLNLHTSDVYSSWIWGEYKQRVGWGIYRLSVWDKEQNSLMACFQLQKKIKFKLFTILVIQGGIHLKTLSLNKHHQVLESIMNKYVTGKNNVIIFINQQSASSQNIDTGLLMCKFSPILNSKSYTYILDSNNNSLKGGALSKNWRHNLKRALNNSKLTYHSVLKLEERKRAFGDLEVFYTNLRGRKNFKTAIDFTLSKDLIIENNDFRIIEARLENQVIAIRIGFFSKDYVLDFLAASDELAKKTYANYLLLYKLIELTHSEGKSYFDCGGINPSENMGVFNFKKGLGGRLNINGPIWLNASSPIIKKAVRLLFSFTN